MYSQVCLNISQLHVYAVRVDCQHYRCKGMLKCPIWVKSKSLRTLQRQLMENEDLHISGDERVQMNNLEVTAEEGKDDKANDSSNTGIYYILIDVTFSDT